MKRSAFIFRAAIAALVSVLLPGAMPPITPVVFLPTFSKEKMGFILSKVARNTTLAFISSIKMPSLSSSLSENFSIDFAYTLVSFPPPITIIS